MDRGASPRAASTVRATSPIARRVTLYVVAHPNGTHAVIEPSQLGEYEGLGFSLKSVVKGVAKVAGNVAKTVKKAAVDTAHVTGKVVTSKVGKTILAGGLALTGAGIPAAAAIMGGTQAVGTLIKPGGNVGKAAKAGATGAAVGVAASVVGKGVRKVAPSITDKSRDVVNKLLPGTPFKPSRKTAVVGQVTGAVTKGTPLKFKKVPDLVHGEKPDVPLPPPPPLVERVAEVATETATQGKKKTPSKRTRIGALIDKAKQAAETVQQVAEQAPSVVYNPGTGPLAAESAPATESKPALPLPLIIGGGALLLVVAMNRK